MGKLFVKDTPETVQEVQPVFKALKIINVQSGEIREAMLEQMSRIVDVIRTTLENTPPELSADIYDSGIMLTGGGAMLRGIGTLISGATGIRVNIPKSPLDCVVGGIGKITEAPELSSLFDFRN